MSPVEPNNTCRGPHHATLFARLWTVTPNTRLQMQNWQQDAYLQQQLKVGSAPRLVGSVLPSGVQLAAQILLRSRRLGCCCFQSACQGIALRCQGVPLRCQIVSRAGDILCLRLQQLDSALQTQQRGPQWTVASDQFVDQD